VRVFQNSGLYPAYLRRLDSLRDRSWTFEQQRAAFLRDGYVAPHILLPVLTADESVFFTNSDDPVLQRQWAREQGMPGSASLESILLAQLEQHRTEIFYNLDPMRYQSGFVRRLPGCVRKSVAWRAAPSPRADFSAYTLVVCNFPGILESYRKRGWGAAYFSPSHHPDLDSFAANTDRPIDVIFVGGYSRHHRRRSQLLEAVARLQDRYRVIFHLDLSRLTRLAESVVGPLLPLGKHRLPGTIRRTLRAGLFGRELYGALSRAKIVLNGAIDMAGDDRGNLRCFEAMGCGALMVSDHGRYPEGMIDGANMLTYQGPEQAVAVIEAVLAAPARLVKLASNGFELMRSKYSKEAQWDQFKNLVG
jgi:glycosyltransferase involved in cell wall biosynthesis